MSDHLGRAQHREVGLEAGQCHGRPDERVGAHPRPAATIAVRLDGRPGAEPSPDVVRRRIDHDLDGVRHGQLLDPRADEGRGVLRGQVPGSEPDAGGDGSLEAVESEAAPVVPPQVVGHEIPAATQRHESRRFHLPLGALAAGRGVREPQSLGVAARLRHRRQRAGVDGRATARPDRHRRCDGHRAQRLDPSPQPRRHDLRDLRQSPDRRFREPLDRRLGRCLQAERERDRFVVVQDQRRQGRARGELVAAVDPALRLNGISQLAQPLDVPPQGAHRDLEPLRELTARPVPMGLEQGEQSHHPQAGARHALQSPRH